MSKPGILHWLFSPITKRLSLAGRVGVLTTFAVAATFGLISATVYLTAYDEFINKLDEAMYKRAENAVEAGYQPNTITYRQAELLSIAGIQLLTVNADGSALLLGPFESVPLSESERQVAFGNAPRSARTVTIHGLPYRIVSVQAGPGQAFVLGQSMESTQQALDRLVNVLLLTSAFGVLLAGLSGWAVASNGLRPIRRLTAATERVTRTNDLTPISHQSSKRHDELSRLTSSFNAMLESLADVQRRERQLIADASHEIRTPLTSLRTNIDLLRQIAADPDADFDAAEGNELLDDIATQLAELTTLVGDLTELARDEPLHRDPEPLDLAEVVQRSLNRVQLRANDVVFVNDFSPCWVIGDSQLLERAMTNLLDNAVKWSSPGDTVTTTVKDGVVTVKDEGPGIAPADLPHVFDRFWRAEDARGMPGSGLGLSIVKQAASRHGGTVSVRSEVGKGSTFVFAIACTQPNES
ncbi:MAG: HAMP domain-containing histidine kinase [Aeromicrobium sp.]|nr:MAG: HAMP domain-containing histidine kinase [Aeromicrobium sp.]